jgi:orotidine-5'-phosphate decarboxylase
MSGRNEGLMAERLSTNRSIVLAADVEPEKFVPLVSMMEGVEGLSGVKVGLEVGLGLGLDHAADAVKEANSELEVTYDHQKAGNDIPATGANFARAMERAAEMTHDQIAASLDGQSEGYVHPEAFRRMFALAIELGVRDFVVPGNKPDAVAGYREFFEHEIGEGEFTLWAPGFVTQGGDVSETGAVAGPNFNAIVGSGIYKAENPHQAAYNLGQKILSLS